jgi:gliding motility-associated-like protein
MKRFLLVITTFFLFSAPSYAAHIKGGFFNYQYLGPGAPGNARYKITLTVYMLCTAGGLQISDPINFSIFNPATNQLVLNPSVPKIAEYLLNKVYDEPCISGNQIACYYKIVIYELSSIELPITPEGYIIAYQRCCRIPGIQNISGSGSVGSTFTTKIPGSASFPGAEVNSSPAFLINDTAVVCKNSYFQYSFQASDADGDSLSYSFCDAFLGGDAGANAAPNPAANPPYIPVPYQSPYTGTQPMGSSVFINPTTGVISGIAPNVQGEFVICVCVNEYRSGVLISTTRKELHIQVADCEPLKAQLDPTLTTCDGFLVNFSNNVSNPPGTVFLWTFGDPASGPLDTSNLEITSHDYTNTGAGTYTVKLKVTLSGGACVDSTSMQVNVFPGFFPGFKVTGGCYQNPFQFTDTTRTNYGIVNTWRWDFGDASTLADTSHLQNPQWTYSSPGPKTVTLIVSNSKGCVNNISVPIIVLDKPALTLAFADTLICSPDAVTLGANGTGTFSWTPNTNIVNANTSTPTVNPVTDTWYVVNLNDNGCVNKDSVHVRVVSGVTLKARADTTICLTDAVQLNANTNGLTFQWTPSGTLNNPTIVNPVATPTDVSTTYQVRAFIGSCFADDEIIINTVPYPFADAGLPQILCFNKAAQLNGSHNGTTFSWTPTSYLNNPNILNPIASPPRTTTYILTSFDNKGCPKPGRDTIVITVLPRVRAYAGRDTVVVVGQPLQFTGSGGLNYLWSPATGLTSTTIYNPIGVYNGTIDSIRYKLIVSDIAGCTDSAFIIVRVYKVKPTVFVPTAFTPNGDGKNDKIYPISVGIKKINYFSVYNRWGELVFTTTVDRAGWDGTISGRTQDSGVFVWMVSAVDYTGRAVFLKGTVALIR